MWNIYTMENYEAMKTNEIMLSASTEMDLDIITLCEVRQTKTNSRPYCLYVEI